MDTNRAGMWILITVISGVIVSFVTNRFISRPVPTYLVIDEDDFDGDIKLSSYNSKIQRVR